MHYALISACLCLMAVFLVQESKKKYIPAVILKKQAT